MEKKEPNKKQHKVIRIEVPDEAMEDSNFISTPFSFVKYEGNFALSQQKLIFSVSGHLQNVIKDYYDQRRMLGEKRGYSLFVIDENDIAMNIPDIHVKFWELGITPNNYNQSRTIFNKVINMLVKVPDKRGEAYQHVFSKITFPKRLGKTNDSSEEDLDGNEVILTIDPKYAKFVFDMGQGYIIHQAAIAQNAQKSCTPKLYIYLKRLYDLKKCKETKLSAAEAEMYATKVSHNIRVPFEEVKDFTGYYERNDKGEIVKVRYPRFSHFKAFVLDAAKEDMIRMCNENNIEIIFDYIPIYKYDRKRGDPDEIEFHIMLSGLGEAKRKKSKKGIKGKDTEVLPITTSEGDLFSHVAKTISKPNIEKELGRVEWNKLLALYSGAAKLQLSRATFYGMRNGSLCYSLQKDDMIDDNELDAINEIAKKILGISNRFQPGIVKK